MGDHQQAAGSHTPREALDRLRDLAGSGELAAFCTQHDIRLLVAFGSAVTGGGQAPARDLDLAVLPDRCSDGSGWVELVSELIHLVRFDDVDVLNLARAGVLARANALGVGLPLYEEEAGLFAREQMAALGQRMELGWLAELDLELLAER